MRKRLVPYLMMSLFFSVFIIKGAAMAEPVVVIVNANSPVQSLTLKEVKRYYENDVLKWSDGKSIVLYDLPIKKEARKKFSGAVLGKNAKEVAMEWANKKITNTAKNPPRTLISDVLTQDRVSKDEAAIGYLLKSRLKNKNVKIVATIE